MEYEEMAEAYSTSEEYTQRRKRELSTLQKTQMKFVDFARI